VTEGRTNREIAEELGMTEGMLAPRMAVLFAKVGAVSRAEAISAAVLERLV
jgi:DNA-binding NarL/FixJ family response regulator